MKLFSKIFLSTMLILTLALSIQEYAVISYSFQNSVEREREDGINQFRLLRYALQSNMVRKKQSEELGYESLKKIGEETYHLIPEGCGMELYYTADDVYTLLYSSGGGEEERELRTFEKGKVYTSIRQENKMYYLLVEGKVEQAGYSLALVMKKDITSVFQSKRELERNSRLLYCGILAGAACLSFAMSYFMTKPIKKLKAATKKIAEGEYGERVKTNTKDEIGELGNHFNQMAEQIQDNIEQIQLEAQKKEQFVSDFAHELKTPLTSIIGYADRIYQSDMGREETKKAAEYIFSEGMRLESLAFKMMDLAVLNEQKLVKEVVDAKDFEEDIRMTFERITGDREIIFRVFLESAWVKVEYDFFKTLLVNLLDNAVKAGSTKIAFTGKVREGGVYEFRVTDNGCGIPKEDLDKITEAFYMVDKARSRKMNGAGLGLAIAQKIALMHGTTLEYQSKEGVGTSVVFRIPMEEAADETD